jgi:hypothetical protein
VPPLLKKLGELKKFFYPRFSLTLNKESTP